MSSRNTKNVSLKVNSRRLNGVQVWEGTVSIPGTRPTKLVQKDNSPQFKTRSSVLSAARYLGKRIGATVVETVPTTTQRAAKKSVTTRNATTTSTNSSGSSL